MVGRNALDQKGEAEEPDLMEHFDPNPQAPVDEIEGPAHADPDLRAALAAVGLPTPDLAAPDLATPDLATPDLAATGVALAPQAAPQLAPELAPTAPAGSAAGEPAPAALAAPVPDAAAQPIRARVIRMRRADFDRAVSEGRLDPVPAAARPLPRPAAPVPAAVVATTPVEAALVVSALSPEAEADLMAELAEMERESPPEAAGGLGIDQTAGASAAPWAEDAAEPEQSSEELSAILARVAAQQPAQTQIPQTQTAQAHDADLSLAEDAALGADDLTATQDATPG